MFYTYDHVYVKISISLLIKDDCKTQSLVDSGSAQFFAVGASFYCCKQWQAHQLD